MFVTPDGIAIVSIGKATTEEQELILPNGLSADKFSYTFPNGVTFGSATSLAQIAKDIAVYATGTTALRMADTGTKLVKVPFTVVKRFTTAKSVAARTKTYAESFEVKLNLKALNISGAEKKSIAKRKIKALVGRFTVKTKTGTFVSAKFKYKV